MRPFRLERTGEPLLDIWSYGRGPSGSQPRLTPAQIEYIRRTVTRTPEVMVKVTGGGGASSSRGINAHFSYIGRRGELAIETDDGERLSGRNVGLQLGAVDIQGYASRPTHWQSWERDAKNSTQ